MIGRYFYGALAVAILVASASISTYAQVGELRGKVVIKQADGQALPLADAQIDVFRTDMNGSYKTKTNKKGEFVFAGLPFVGTYTVAASHPTARPNFVPGVKAGRDVEVEVTLSPGDGKRLTFDEIKSAGGGTANPPAAGGGSGGGESAADKAKREEMLKKNAEIENANKKIEATNEVIGRTFKAGNDALAAGTVSSKSQNSDDAVQKFTMAVASYDEGLAADPEQPAILTNKAIALKARGVERFNTAVRGKLDDAAKTAALQAAKDDFKASCGNCDESRRHAQSSSGSDRRERSRKIQRQQVCSDADECRIDAPVRQQGRRHSSGRRPGGIQGVLVGRNRSGEEIEGSTRYGPDAARCWCCR